MGDISLETSRKTEFVDITEDINKVLTASTSIVLIFTKHTTSGLTINENEAGLIDDMEGFLREIIPKRIYKHDGIDDNADSHIRSLFLEHSLVLPVSEGKLELGTWQKVFFVELDGPRKRKVLIRQM